MQQQESYSGSKKFLFQRHASSSKSELSSRKNELIALLPRRENSGIVILRKENSQYRFPLYKTPYSLRECTSKNDAELVVEPLAR